MTLLSQEAAFISGEENEIVETEEERESEVLEIERADDDAPESVQERTPEDMLVIMERFRMMVAEDSGMSVLEMEEVDLLILMGSYLRTIDV